MTALVLGSDTANVFMAMVPRPQSPQHNTDKSTVALVPPIVHHCHSIQSKILRRLRARHGLLLILLFARFFAFVLFLAAGIKQWMILPYSLSIEEGIQHCRLNSADGRPPRQARSTGY